MAIEECNYTENLMLCYDKCLNYNYRKVRFEIGVIVNKVSIFVAFIEL